MSQGDVVAQVNLKDIVLSNGSFGPSDIKEISKLIGSNYSNYGQLRDAVSDLEQIEERSPATSVRLGVCYYLLGRYERAIETLSNADGGALSHFYLGKAHFARESYDRAIASYESAKKAGYDKEICDLAIVEAKRYSKDTAGALAILDNMFGAIEQTAEYLYQRGATIAAVGDNPNEVVALYERAVDADDAHAGALFGLALENDRRGNDEVALRLYQRAAGMFPSHVGLLLNLGVLYEDREEYDKAQSCYQRILEAHPAHPRARLYYR
ncbi:MAG: tetratricopeptide repeat protein, partial [Planctomycetales bacterium]|nr:tetratricopeptide repeat protein [Planctomycetales bacterium]